MFKSWHGVANLREWNSCHFEVQCSTHSFSKLVIFHWSAKNWGYTLMLRNGHVHLLSIFLQQFLVGNLKEMALNLKHKPLLNRRYMKLL